MSVIRKIHLYLSLLLLTINGKKDFEYTLWIRQDYICDKLEIMGAGIFVPPYYWSTFVMYRE